MARNEQELLDNIHKGIKAGVKKAVLEHKKAGRSISAWQNGQVVRIPPEEIVVEE